MRSEFLKLKDVCLIKGGYAFKSTQFVEKGVPLIRIGDISDNKVNITESTVYISETHIDKYKNFIINNGDILVALSGATTGKFGIYDSNEVAFLNQRVGKIVPKLNLNNRYVYHYMNKLKDIIYDNALGAAQPNISPTDIEQIEIFVPELEIQQKIVYVLDKAKELLGRRETQMKALDELIISVFYEMFGDPIKNNKKLNKCKLSELGNWKSGGTPSRTIKEYFQGNVPWLSSGELNNMYCYESLEMITKDAINNSSAKLIEVGSLLLGMYDTAALKSTINMIECTCNQAIAYAKIDEEIANTIYVYYCIQIGKDHYKSQQRGVRQKNLNLTMIRDIEIILPSLSDQIRFVQLVDAIENQKQLLKQSLTELQNNYNSLMQRAFKGELFS